jgi:hypothetical protein
MAAFNFFNDFFERLGKKEIDLNGDTLKVYLTNATPSATDDSVIGDLAEISAANGYSAGGADIQNTYTETAGTGTLAAVDVVWTPDGGSFGPFRYAVIYDDTHASDVLIGWMDFGSNITATATPVLTPITVNFGASLLTIAVAT